MHLSITFDILDTSEMGLYFGAGCSLSLFQISENSSTRFNRPNNRQMIGVVSTPFQQKPDIQSGLVYETLGKGKFDLRRLGE